MVPSIGTSIADARRDHPLQRDPPQSAAALGEIARDIDRERGAELAHHRQREIAVVAIAVVEGKAGEAPREIPFGETAMRLVDADHVDVERAQMRQHRAQEVRRDLEMMVRLERVAAPRADVVQHEDGADAGEDRPQQDMRTREIQRLHAGTDHGVAELFHVGAGRPICIPRQT
ncbi:hypothetical protein ACVMDO_000956 [Bradyrhizobium sp. USDA 4513]